MNRIDTRFETLKKQNKKALITFITAGDPDIKTTEQLILEMEQAGADLIEIGVPFSDPVAEGPVIEAASLRALKNAVTLHDIFSMVERLRKKTDMPLLLMMYLNSLFKYGSAAFFSRCKEAGIDGVIVPDMPFEERDEIIDEARAQGVSVINLVAPTSKARIAKIAADSEGFLYCVSSLGVTGLRSDFTTDFNEFFSEINKHTTVPTALGFGISGPEQVKALKQYADGLIVGSAIVKIVGEYGEKSSAHVSSFVRELKAALN